MDIFHTWGADLAFAANGDLLTATGPTETTQRLLRGLLTAAGEYLFHPAYGVGAGQDVGLALTSGDYAQIQARIQGLVGSDAGVAATPAPTFDFQMRPDGRLGVRVQYADARNGALQTLAFTVSK